MNPSIKKLAETANKPSRKFIGLMSGTSLDGLDIAFCTISGSGFDTTIEIEQFTTVSYNDETREKLKQITSVEKVSLAEVCYQHTWLGNLHAEMILKSLYEWNIKPEEIDCIASHGQTIYHFPERDQKTQIPAMNSTLQIADADQIAARTGILTISDFRQKQIAMGGEGAPLAALVDRILFTDQSEQRILLNIGGIANFTFLPSDKSDFEGVFTTDTGPGNTLIDQFCQKYYQKPYDEDGLIAASGTIHEKLLDALLKEPWFDEVKTKTSGPEFFNIQWAGTKAEEAGIALDDVIQEDLIRTITELSARTITDRIKKHLPEPENIAVYVSGGGAQNTFLINRIGELIPETEIKNVSCLRINPDAKEAVIFAVLANEMLAGSGFTFRAKHGYVHNINFGKISFPV
jgi:anhydro-N-acetylmuramic acid kinase